MAAGTANLLQMLEDRVRELCYHEKWDEAVSTAEVAVRKAREVGDAQPEIVGELALSLEVKGDLVRQLGNDAEALKEYEEAVDLLDGRKGYEEQFGRICSTAAVICDELGFEAKARIYYEKAIKVFREMDSLLDVADLSNNLAFIYEAEEDFVSAENLLLDALKITRDQLGKDHVETASICNNLGTLYQKSEHFSRARELHSMALDARVTVCGDTHPDTGQSHGNLAAALAAEGELAKARSHFEKAMIILERHLVEVPEDYETVALNYAQFLRAIGEEKGALQVAKRSSKKLKKLLKR